MVLEAAAVEDAGFDAAVYGTAPALPPLVGPRGAGMLMVFFAGVRTLFFMDGTL